MVLLSDADSFYLVLRSSNLSNLPADALPRKGHTHVPVASPDTSMMMPSSDMPSSSLPVDVEMEDVQPAPQPETLAIPTKQDKSSSLPVSLLIYMGCKSRCEDRKL